MSGIFGFWNLDGRPADPALLHAMSNALAHRGPDGWDGWCKGAVGIGHRMLRVTPESFYESQPMVSSTGIRVLAADLRLDNREELIQHLRLQDRAREGLSDAELLLRTHEAAGQSAPERLLGAFAFVVWDDEHSKLLCVRDHFGEKPLYYFHVPGRIFAFASEIKALWVLNEVPEEINDLEVARHLLIPVQEDLGSTYYKAVRKILPGHRLIVTPARLEESQYWALDHTRSLSLSSDGEYAEAVRDVFVEAVRCRLRSQGPVASMLSGGIDSSSIACVAARLLAERGTNGPLKTLSGIYPDVPASDERRYIQKVQEAYATEANYFRADQQSPVGRISELNWRGDGANRAGNLYLNGALYDMASAGGARVVLDGFDGDSTLSHGQGWLVELAFARRWFTLAREVKAKAEMLDEPWLPAVRAWFFAYGIAPALKRLPFRRALGGRRSPGVRTLAQWTTGLAPEFSRKLAGQIIPPEPMLRTEREHHRRLMWRPILLDSLSWLEATGAGAGVEVRFPFFDIRLVNLCISLPPEQKLRRGWSRFVMRQAMAGILPEAIRWRRDKSNIEPGFYHALRSQQGVEVGGEFSNADGRIAVYLDSEYCSEVHRRLMAGSVSRQERTRFWRIYSLALWLTGSNGARSTHRPLTETNSQS